MLVALADYNNPRSLGSRLRRRRNRLIVELIDAIYSQKKSVRICDLGGRRAYWRDFGEDYLKSRGVHITLVNFEAEISDAAQDPRFTPVCGDACSLSQFADGSFDLAHSNSVIEHVGGWERVKQFAAETRRLAPAIICKRLIFGVQLNLISLHRSSIGGPRAGALRLLCLRRWDNIQRRVQLARLWTSSVMPYSWTKPSCAICCPMPQSKWNGFFCCQNR
jgi:Methyltransferase domain